MLSPLSGLAPAYVRELFSERGTDCELRNFFHKLTSVKPCSFCCSGAVLWNSLLESTRKIKSTAQFKKEIDLAIMRLSNRNFNNNNNNNNNINNFIYIAVYTEGSISHRNHKLKTIQKKKLKMHKKIIHK